MKFTRVIGNVDPNLVVKAEEKLSLAFLELGGRYDNANVNQEIGGGDPFIFSLIYPAEHVCTESIATAATDGIRYYWNPKFVLKHSRIGLRILCTHEAGHAIYMHPQRRGSRLPKLWNIAVDYIVNGLALDDFKSRGKDAGKLFKDNLGRYMTLDQYVQLLKDPFKPLPGFEDLDVAGTLPSAPATSASPNHGLSPKEKKDLERRSKPVAFFYADPDLKPEMKSPERIYELLYNLLPKCPECGSIGMYKVPKNKQKKDKNSGKDKGDQQKGQGSPSDQGDPSDQDGDQDGQGGSPGDQEGCGHNCGSCGAGGDSIDIFGLGGTVDDHIDSEETQEKLAKKIAEAMESAKRMAGHVPAGYEDELGNLTEPKIRWQDHIRGRILKARAGNGRNDWNRFKSRPMFCGLMQPKRKSFVADFICLLDTSGSMSQEDMAFGISQLQALDERNEGTILSCDCEIYWDSAVKIRKCKKEELNKVKVVGRGGTYLCPFFEEYEERIGVADFLIVITDGYLSEREFVEMKNPTGKPVYWLITSGADFQPPFGKVFNLRNE